MAEPVTVTRPATPDRWHKALDRAFAQSITVRQLECGVWTATSGTDPRAAYAVTLFDCECRAAAEGDPICKHRAALAYELGHLEPADAPDAPVCCPVCTGTGIPPAALRLAHCPMCNGAGGYVPGEPWTARYQPTPAPTPTATDRAVALIERMAATDPDATCDLFA